jgi:hypothetical protein
MFVQVATRCPCEAVTVGVVGGVHTVDLCGGQRLVIARVVGVAFENFKLLNRARKQLNVASLHVTCVLLRIVKVLP